LSGSDVVDNLTSTSTNTPLSANQGKVLDEKIAEHTSSKSNPHAVTKAQVGLGNVPNVATNDQTPTYSATTTLSTLKSGEKLNIALQKIQYAITSLINHINAHKISTYVSFSEIGVTSGSETIASIATGMPSNSELLVTIGADNAAIYPQSYGVLHVIKKDATRTVFKFYSKTTAYEYLGIYDNSQTTKWSGWVYSLSGSDVVDNLTSTSTNTPLSAKQGKVLNEKIIEPTLMSSWQQYKSNLAIHMCQVDCTRKGAQYSIVPVSTLTNGDRSETTGILGIMAYSTTSGINVISTTAYGDGSNISVVYNSDISTTGTYPVRFITVYLKE